MFLHPRTSNYRQRAGRTKIFIVESLGQTDSQGTEWKQGGDITQDTPMRNCHVNQLSADINIHISEVQTQNFTSSFHLRTRCSPYLSSGHDWPYRTHPPVLSFPCSSSTSLPKNDVTCCNSDGTTPNWHEANLKWYKIFKWNAYTNNAESPKANSKGF